jgi:adenosyl cobinamide kinase/adenosyl cobinamide phosphate guanylyltransferase
MVIVVIGGSGSGKSEFAENLAVKLNQDHLIYIATMQPFGEEGRKRIVRHQMLRQDKNFHTIECYTDLDILSITKESTVLLECMSNLVANEMFSDGSEKVDIMKKQENKIVNQGSTYENQGYTFEDKEDTFEDQGYTFEDKEDTFEAQGSIFEDKEDILEDHGYTFDDKEDTLEDQGNTFENQGDTFENQGHTFENQGHTFEKYGHTPEKVMLGIKSIINLVDRLIIVTNNVFEDGFRYDDTTMEYRKVLGQVNQQICSTADQVIEVVHGIPVYLKTGKEIKKEN